MKERHTTRVAVFLLLLRENPNMIGTKQILLQKRQNTGYMDNMYDACASGHLDPNESILEAMKREAKEEIGINIEKEDLELVTTYHASSKDNEVEYLRFYFVPKKITGEPQIGEPEKCSELVWVDVDSLPENTIWHFKKAVSNYLKGLSYGQDEF